VAKYKNTQLNCFSPPVMVATLIIELGLFAYTVWRYKLTVVTRLALLAVAALAIFQASEYQVCTGFGLNAENWSRLGYVAITTLPPLGLHIMHVLAGKPGRRLVVAGYALMAGFIIYFLSYHAAFIGYQCTGNYVIYQIGKGPSIAYGLYYYSGLFTAIGLGVKWANEVLRSSKSQRAKSQAKLQTIQALIIGYLVFLVPTALANSVNPESRRGIPSIMCGFAVLFALILVLYILPRATRSTAKKKR
jgi:hypothetical protein